MGVISTARVNLEAILSDKQWHDFRLVYSQVKVFIDPRVAMRAALCQHRSYGRHNRKILTDNEIWEILETNHDHYMESGRKQRFLTLIRDLHVEWRGHTPKARDGQIRLCQCGGSKTDHSNPRHVTS